MKKKKSVLAKRWTERNTGKRMSVSGSRTLKDERVKIILMEQIEKHGIEMVVTHAEPDGVCGVARNYCKENAIPLTLHSLNFRKLRGAWYHRTIAVFMDCDYALFIHDGKSQGTANELEVAKKMEIPHEFFKLDPPPNIDDESVGFEIKVPWRDVPVEMAIDINEFF